MTEAAAPSPADPRIVLEARGLTKTFREAGRELEVLRGIDLSVRAGERIAIIGASGSGKTTLLQLLGGLDRPTAGSVIVGGQPISDLSEAAQGRLRNAEIGFVYQFHHLLPEFTALENVAMPLLVRGDAPRQALSEAARTRRPCRADPAPARQAVGRRASAHGRRPCAGDSAGRRSR
jgi:lipoprotein-releasing system ATP-binding protein